MSKKATTVVGFMIETDWNVLKSVKAKTKVYISTNKLLIDTS